MDVDALLSEIAARYALGALQAGPLLQGGEWNQVLRFEAARGPLVCRVAHPTTRAASLAYAHQVMQRMSGTLPEVAPPLAQTDGSTILPWEGKLAAVFPFLPGHPVRAEEDEVPTAAARVLAALHRAGLAAPPAPHPVFQPLRERDWDRNPLWNWSRIAPLLAGKSDATGAAAPVARECLRAFAAALNRERIDLAARLREFRAWIGGRAAAPHPPLTGIIHGDYYPSNLLGDGATITGVIDWDECRPEWLVYELARATWEFCSAAGTLSPQRAQRFIQAYREQGGPVPERDLDLITGFIRYTRLEDTLFDLNEALRGGNWDDEYTEYHLENLRAMEALAEQPPLA